MKILVTVSTYFPRKDGVAKVTQYLSEGLVKKGNKVTIITTNKHVDKEFENINGVEIKRVNLYTKFGLYIGDKNKYKQMIFEECKKCDVMINVCTQNAFTDLILKDIDKFNCKKILYLHGIFDFKFSKINFSSFTSIINKFWKEIRWFFYYRLNGKYFKKYDAVTQLHEKDYGNIYFKKKYNINSIIIENAADQEFFDKKTIKNFVKPFEKYIILVANYDDRKNQKLAISEFLKTDIDKNIGLVLIGSRRNKYYEMLEKYIITEKKKLNLSVDEKPIKMLYGVDRTLVSSYVSNAYLYLMTSKWEAYPISILETMVGGITANKNDINYWIKRLVESEKLRNELSNVCISYANENFKIDDKVEILNKLINKI